MKKDYNIITLSAFLIFVMSFLIYIDSSQGNNEVKNGFSNPSISINNDKINFIYWDDRWPSSQSESYLTQFDVYGNLCIESQQLEKYFIDTMFTNYAIDNNNEIYWIIAVNGHRQNYLYKTNSEGNILFEKVKIKKEMDVGYSYKTSCVDNNNNLHLLYLMASTNNSEIYSYYYYKFDANGNMQVSKSISQSNDNNQLSFISIDDENMLHILIHNHANTKFEYMRLDEFGNIIINRTELNDISVVPSQPIIVDDKGNYHYLDDNGIVDSRNNVHVITSNSDSCDAEPAYLLYTKLDRTGTKLVENHNIATHEKKKECEQGPAIFDPKVAIDSEDNIHITWCINDGAFTSIWYEKVDPNGTVLIPAMKIAPEDEAGDDGGSTPGFGVEAWVGFVVLVGFAVLVVVFWGKRRREGG